MVDNYQFTKPYSNSYSYTGHMLLAASCIFTPMHERLPNRLPTISSECTTLKLNAPWHILAPSAVACDNLHLRASAHHWHVSAFLCNREFLGISYLHKKTPNKHDRLFGVSHQYCDLLAPLKRDSRCSVRNIDDSASLKALFFQGFLHDLVIFVGVDPDVGYI